MTTAATSKGSNGNTPGNARQFTVHRIYLKDVSFESPNSPAVFSEQMSEPEIELNLRTTHRDLGEGYVEVGLHIRAEAKHGDRTLFLVEVEQSGIFQLAGFPPAEAQAVIGVACPNTLFPYAREAVSTLVQRGGFPPLLLQPIDFAVLFSQQQSAKGSGEA
jgi:preprotein translocase subunit SecB